MGATGDLSTGKLFPALYELHKHNRVGDFAVVGASRRKWSDEDFRNFLGNGYDKKFLENVFYREVFFDTCTGAPELKDFLKTFGDAKFVFYVSMAPNLHETAFHCMKTNKLLDIGDTKILIEKPFGLDLPTAKRLNKLAMSFLDHNQIYRVDHYLGKDALRALVEIHEKSDELSKIISNKTVTSIRARMFETVGVKDRGESYDGVGAFRDVGQNHILQMLSVVAAVPPRTKYFSENSLRSNIPKNILSATAWHTARAKVVESIDVSKNIKIRIGQYDGYTTEKNVPKESKTETAFSIETTFTGGKLKGVPVILESGKKMLKQDASIKIEFKNGESLDIPVLGNAYEHVLSAAAADRRELFVGSKEIFAAWKFVDTVVKRFPKIPLEIYKDGHF